MLTRMHTGRGETDTAAEAPHVVVRYWAAAREAAGADEEVYAARTVDDALRQARHRHADRPHYARVLGICSLLVDGQRVEAVDAAFVSVSHGTTIEVLPPFAGG